MTDVLNINITNMSYCPQCGTQIPESSSYCPKCGSSVAQSQSNTEPDFDLHYYENKRLSIVERNKKTINRCNIGLILAVVFYIIALLVYSNSVMGIILSSCASLNAFCFLFVSAICRHRAKNKVKKWTNMSAHDLYMDEKKDSQDMANLANGMKAVNTGMKIGQLLGGL